MKRRILFGSLLAAMIIGFFAMLAWLAGTEAGARWLLGRVSQFSTVTITVDRLAGCLATDLMIEGVHIRHADREIMIAKGKFSWRLWELALGRMTLAEVSLQGISWREEKPDSEPPNLTWPKVPPWLARLWGGIRVFQMDNFVYLRPDGEPIAFDRLRARLEWRFGTLTVSEMDGQFPIGRLSGILGVGFTEPALFGEVALRPGHALAGIDQLTLVMTPAKATGREQAAGDLRLTALAGKEVRINALGRVGIKKEGVIIHDLQVRDPVRFEKATVKGNVDLVLSGIDANLQFLVAGLRPDQDSKEKADLSGTISLKGNLKEYGGRLTLHQQMSIASWMSGHFQGDFAGDERGLTVRDATGAIMGGHVAGRLEWTWKDGHRFAWAVQGTHLNPAAFRPGWHGHVSLRADGTLAWFKSEPLQGRFRMILLDSMLQGRSVGGSLEARWERGMLRLDRCAFRGRGFQLTAQGSLEERIAYQARVTDLSGLLPDMAGQINAAGWVRREKGEWAGVLKGRGASLSVLGLTMESVDISARVSDQERDHIAAIITCGKSTLGPLSVTRARLDVAGKLSGHTIQVSLTGAEGEARVSLAGQYTQQKWQASMTEGWIRDRRTGTLQLSRPATVYLSRERMGISGLALTGGAEESLWAEGDFSFKSRKGNLSVRWKKLNLARANVLLDAEKLTGETTGSLSLAWSENRLVNLAGSGTGGFTWTQDGRAFAFEGASFQVAGNGAGLTGTWSSAMKESGSLEGSFSSSVPVGFNFPDTGRFQVTWRSIDVGLLKPWFGKAVQPTGRMNGQLQGLFQGESRVEMDGRMDISAGQLAWQTAQGVIATSIRRAMVTFKGNKKKLQGDLSLETGEYGQVTGTFVLPVISYVPFRLDDEGPIRLQAKGKLQEKGLLSAIFPGIVKETRGQVQFDIGAAGTWKQPDFRGTAVLEGAGAYFPGAGIRLEGANAEIKWIQDQIRVQSFRVRLGGSDLRGAATFWIKSGRISRYEGTLTGKHVQMVYLPEIRVWATPDLQFSGTEKELILRGSLQIPEALIQFAETKGVVRASRDVMILDFPKKKKKTSTIVLDADIAVVLGDKVQIRVEGLQGYLRGKFSVRASGREDIKADGRMEIVQGSYEQYGVKLDIVRGQAVFKGEPVEMGNLDILAIKTIRGSQGSTDVQAGVAISGNLRSPFIKLYGRPSMSDQDVIAYMVLGRPYRQDAGQSQKEQMAQWAGAILAGSPSSSFPRQLKERLGIDSVGVETGSSGGLNRSLVTVGKYLSPDLYVAFGRSLFGDDYYVSTRYSFLKNWQIESRVGLQSGADLYYRIEFD